MKRIFFFISFFTIVLNTITAQNISIMPKLGTSISHAYQVEQTIGGSWFGVTKEDNKTSTTGLTGGVAVNITLSRIFSFQPELLYIQKGYTTNTVQDTIYKTSYSRKISYMEMPLLVKASYNIGKLKLHAIAGPSLAFALGGNYKDQSEYLGKTTSGSGTIYFKSWPAGYNGNNQYYTAADHNRVDIGLQFGGGVGYELGPGTIILDARYGIGLINFERKLNNGNPGSNPFNNVSKFRALAITLGYSIPLHTQNTK
jgi:hypothetical protein